MALEYSSSRIVVRGGQRIGLRDFHIAKAQPGAVGIVVLRTDAPFNWMLEMVRHDPKTGKPRQRPIKVLRRSHQGLIYLRLPRMKPGHYTLAAMAEDVDQSWIRLYVTDGTPPSPDQDIGHRIDSLGISVAAVLEPLLADLEVLIGGTPLPGGEGKALSLDLGTDECFINHTPGCTSGSTEDGDMPECGGALGGTGDTKECDGGLGSQGDNPCGGSGLYAQHVEEPCQAFDLACGISGNHIPTPCGERAFDVPVCLVGDEETPCTNPATDMETAPACTNPPSHNWPDPLPVPDCANPPADTWGPGPSPCGILVGQPTYIFQPPACSSDDTFNCNLIHVKFIKRDAEKKRRLGGLARVDLPDYIYALFGSRIEHQGVSRQQMKRLAKAAGKSPKDLRLIIDLLNAAADVAVALFDEIQTQLHAEAGGV